MTTNATNNTTNATNNTTNAADARYIPTGTRLALRDSAGVPQWYTTRKDVPVVGDPTPTRCPMGTNAEVVTIRYQGFDLFFQPSAVRTRVSAERAASLSALRPQMLMYDIPDRAEIPNPSGWLSRIAVRINLSVWVIPENNVPYTRLNQLTEAGARWHVIPFDTSAAAQLVDMAVVSIREEIADAVVRAERTRDAIAAELSAAENDPAADVVSMRKRAEQRAAAVQKRIRDLIDNLTTGAAVFGIDARHLGVSAASAAASAISTAMHQRAAAFADAARKAAETRASGAAAMAAAVAADAVPVGVVADFIDENGGNADALRAAFAPTVSADDDHTFALGGDEADVA